jgi:hypothetical protein
MAWSDQCCIDINAQIDRLETEAKAVETEFRKSAARDLLYGWSGIWTDLCPPDHSPSIAEIIGRISAFGVGFGVWEFEESRFPAPAAINMPKAINPAKTIVYINGVSIPSDQYGIAGTIITLDFPLEVGDQMKVKTYGN